MPDDFTNQPAPDQLVVGGPQAPRSRKGWWIGGGALAVLAIGGGAAAWAALSFFGQGSQPAEALPDSTVGYVSIDLDPSGAQKIAALKLARKFPAFKDKVGLDSGDDIRRWIFDQMKEDTGCKLDFDKDVEPWLGSRAAMAAVGTDKPVPVVVVQTKDSGKAESGVKKLLDCSGDTGDFGWTVDGDWIVFAESTDQAEQVVRDAEKASLADDEDFKSWTDKAGDSGILAAYAAPAAGRVLAQEFGGVASEASGASAAIDPFDMLGSCPGLADPSAADQRLLAQLSDFRGAAATLRFGDDGVELETVGDTRAFGVGAVAGRTTGTPVVTTLPDDTAVALGVSLPKGWTDRLATTLQGLCGDGSDPSALFGSLSQATGLDLPGDLEKLFGTSAALSLGSGFDVEALVNSGDPTQLPIAIKTTGQRDAIDQILTKLRTMLGVPPAFLSAEEGKTGVAVAANGDYARRVAEDGKLGSSEAFTSVVPHADKASGVLFVSFDALDKAIDAISGGDQEIKANLAPLRALGVSGWSEGQESHGLLKVTVD